MFVKYTPKTECTYVSVLIVIGFLSAGMEYSRNLILKFNRNKWFTLKQYCLLICIYLFSLNLADDRYLGLNALLTIIIYNFK